MVKFSRLIQQFQTKQLVEFVRRYRASSERTVRPTVCMSTTKQQFVLIFLRSECHPTLLWPNGWMDEDATWYGSRPPRRPHCIRRVPSAPRKGHSTPSPFLGPCLLWPRSPISATPELLFKLSTVQKAKVCRQAKTSGDRSKNYIFIVCRLKRVKMHQCTKYHSDSLTIAKLW